MNHTVRFQKILERAQELAQENNLEYIDIYCVAKAMLEGDPTNMLYLACIGINLEPDKLIIELDRINSLREIIAQYDKHNPLNQPSDTPPLVENK